MNPTTKNKLFTWLVVLLLIANAITIAGFWLGRPKHPPLPQGAAADYLIKELSLTKQQQKQFLELVSEHQQSSAQIRIKIRDAKDNFFDLLKQPGLTDSVKRAAVEMVGKSTQELDLLTLDHFQKVRALCTVEQQKKFDTIIRDVTHMMAPPHPGGPGPQGPPPGGPHDGLPPNDMPPPQQQ